MATTQPQLAAVPPGPPAWSPRLLAGLVTDPMTTFRDVRLHYGPVARVPVGRGGFYLVCDPAAIQDVLVGSAKDYAKGFRRRSMPPGTGMQPLSILLGEGLLTSAGELHRNRRRLITPMFHRRRVAGFGEQFVAAAHRHSAVWADGARFDVHQKMTELTLDVVARTVFDVDVASDVVATIQRAVAVNLRLSRLALLPGLARLDETHPIGPLRRARDARQELAGVVQHMIDGRRRDHGGGDIENNSDDNDLLSMLLAARDADTGAPLDDAAVRDEALTILLAGHETTANALTWAYTLLGANPGAADEMAAELDAVVGDRLPTFDDLPSLPYTRAVFNESMRLYPPAWILIRRTLREVELGGYRIPADVTVILSQWVVHHDPELWPDPDSFVPRRWLEPTGAAAGRPRFGFFPFGGGTRQCVGNTFAETEGALVLATIGQRWRLEPVPGSKVRPVARVTLRPRKDVPMIARERHRETGSPADLPTFSRSPEQGAPKC